MQLEEMSIEERRQRSALVLMVPAVERLIGRYRRAYTADGAGVPPHITLFTPFLSPQEVTPDVLDDLRRIASGTPKFDLSVEKLARFPGGVMYLAPSPLDPLRELIARLRHAFPGLSPYWDQYDEVIPHITVADLAMTTTVDVLDAIQSDIARHLPVSVQAREMVLLQRIRPQPAPWDTVASFPFAGNPGLSGRP